MFVILLSTLIYGALQTGSSLGTYASYYLYGDSLILIIPIALAFIPQTIAKLNTTKLTNKFGKKKVSSAADQFVSGYGGIEHDSGKNYRRQHRLCRADTE